MSHKELFAVHIRDACAWLARSLRYARLAADADCTLRNRRFYSTWARKAQEQAAAHYGVACRYLHAVADENGDYTPRRDGRRRRRAQVGVGAAGVYRCYG